MVLASILLPAPGGPLRIMLCWPATAMMRARFACGWPIIWSSVMAVSVSVFSTTLHSGLAGSMSSSRYCQSSVRVETGMSFILFPRRLACG